MALVATAVAHAATQPPATAPAKPVPGAPFVSALPSDTEIQRIVDDRVVTYRDSVGLVVGVIDPSGRKLFVRGPARVGNDAATDGDTIYELGGISKVFTALLLTDMARRGELSLSDPVAKFLPSGTTLPQRGHPITLLDLATHTSGLPRMPPNVAVTNLNDPNADMTEDQLLKSVAQYELTRDVGSGYEYSDAGYELLALAEEKASGLDYESLLKARILIPLKMPDTRITSSPEERDHFAAGYDQHLQPVPHATLPAVLGADGMRSTANDLLNFLAANIGLTSSPLAGAMADMTKTRRPTEFAQLKVALGWHVATLNSVEMIWENGQTDGFRAFIGYVPKTRTGVVVLSNAADTIDDIGVHILDKDAPLRHLRREVALSSSSFAKYLGRYQVDETYSVVVTQDGGKLFIQGTGQPRAQMFFEGDDKFFLRIADAEIVFQADSGGRARSVMMTQDGKTASGLLVQ
jgi:CubicO group peptidase (beta-lactamase class C family)